MKILTLLYSLLLHLIYPLKWNFPLISFLTPTLLETLEAPFGIIIGVHNQYLNIVMKKLKNKEMTEETLIYNITNKSFLYLPEKFPEFTFENFK